MVEKRENCGDPAVNEGGTAEVFGPFWGTEVSAVFMPE